MIFAEGTILKPKSLFSFFNHRAYSPIGNVVDRIGAWHKQGAQILYCTSRRGKQAEEIARLLQRFGFAGSGLYFRAKRQKYKDIIEDVKPDILIEDDCKSIGGSWQMCITHVSPEIKSGIRSIIVREFGGIDHLPFSIAEFIRER